MTELNIASSFVAVPQAYMFKECKIGLFFYSWMLTASTHRNREKQIPLRHYFCPRFGKMGQPCILMSGPIQAGMEPVMESAK